MEEECIDFTLEKQEVAKACYLYGLNGVECTY